MDIEIDVSGYYVTRILALGEEPPEGTALTTVEHLGETRQAIRELVVGPSVTEVTVPDEALDAMHESHVASGGQRSRHQVLARHLEDAVLSKHAPSEHWQAARVTSTNDGDQEAHDALQHWVAQFGGFDGPSGRDAFLEQQQAQADAAAATTEPPVEAQPTPVADVAPVAPSAAPASVVAPGPADPTQQPAFTPEAQA